ncbi:hypothetical protein [Cellulomonas sp. C5510]|uniref:hypothetical protein n=1 Tax=Cellulomonas sp. C5510 TaxID=2871170 RepID=UPI001C976EF9|nr:hypothetical protein [Cellulomonas sp. C5510]QZN84686.1 hypothetical protein K5O09_12685 [Cellulomonas sp. C5510]
MRTSSVLDNQEFDRPTGTTLGELRPLAATPAAVAFASAVVAAALAGAQVGDMVD